MRGAVGRRRAFQLLAQTVRGLFILPLIPFADSLPARSQCPSRYDSTERQGHEPRDN